MKKERKRLMDEPTITVRLSRSAPTAILRVDSGGNCIFLSSFGKRGGNLNCEKLTKAEAPELAWALKAGCRFSGSQTSASSGERKNGGPEKKTAKENSAEEAS